MKHVLTPIFGLKSVCEPFKVGLNHFYCAGIQGITSSTKFDANAAVKNNRRLWFHEKKSS